MENTPPPGRTSPSVHDLHLLEMPWNWHWGRRLLLLCSFFAILLPLLILAVSSWKTSAESMERLVEEGNMSALENVSQQIASDIDQAIEIGRAIAAVPGTVEGILHGDDSAVQTRLKLLTLSHPAVHRAYIVNEEGMVWIDHPIAPQAFGTDVTGERWYEEVRARKRPTVSLATVSDYQNIPVVAIALPIENPGEDALLGVLVLEYRLERIAQMLRTIHLGLSGNLYVVDSAGTLMVHPERKETDRFYEEYGALEPIRRALQGSLFTEEYTDPWSGKRMVATFRPLALGQRTWVIVAQQPVVEAFNELRRIEGTMLAVGGVLVLITLAMVGALSRFHLRNMRLSQELQEKNQLLREVASIVESSNDAIIGQTTEGMIRSWNASAEAIFGYSAAEMDGKPLLTLPTEDHREELRSVLRCVHEGKPVKQVETEWERKDGALVPLSLTVSPVKDEDGTIVGSSVIARDITERKQIDQMKDDFISFVSHQLKAPITGIGWLTEMILDDQGATLTAEVRDFVEQIRDVNDKNRRLITDLLNVSRINRGVIAVSVEPASLRDIAALAMRNYVQPAKEKGLELRMECPSEEIVVMADADKAAEAIGNSISNSLKHTAAGSITLTLSRSGAQGIVEVTDTGEGMPQETLQKLFARDKIRSKSVNPEGSSGLGLYIAKNFMELQKGGVTVTSTVGKGTTFRYALPLATPEDIAAAEAKKVQQGTLNS